MAEPSPPDQRSDHIVFDEALITAERPAEPSADPSAEPPARPSPAPQYKDFDPADNIGDAGRSRDIGFDPVLIVGSRDDAPAKEGQASPASRLMLTSPSKEPTSPHVPLPSETAPSPELKTTAERPQTEVPAHDSGLSSRRRDWFDGPFDDYTAGGRHPSYVVPDKLRVAPKPIQTKNKHISKSGGKKKIALDEKIIITGRVSTDNENRATQTRPDSESSPKELTPDIARKIVDSIKDDPLFSSRVKGRNFFEESFKYSLRPIRFGGAGAYRNEFIDLLNLIFKVFGSDKYDLAQDDPFLREMACDGIAAVAVMAIKKHPELRKDIKKVETIHRDVPVFPIVPTYDSPHDAVLIQIGGEIYVFDWHKTLDVSNPVIYRQYDWSIGDDGKGVEYQDYVKGKSLP